MLLYLCINNICQLQSFNLELFPLESMTEIYQFPQKICLFGTIFNRIISVYTKCLPVKLESKSKSGISALCYWELITFQIVIILAEIDSFTIQNYLILFVMTIWPINLPNFY